MGEPSPPGQTMIPRFNGNLGIIGMMNRVARQRMSLPVACRSGLPDGPLHEHGDLAGRAVPPHDRAGVGVDHERGVGEHSGTHRHIREISDEQLVRPGRTEPAFHQVRSPVRARVGDRGPDPLGPGHPDPAV